VGNLFFFPFKNPGAPCSPRNTYICAQALTPFTVEHKSHEIRGQIQQRKGRFEIFIGGIIDKIVGEVNTGGILQ